MPYCNEKHIGNYDVDSLLFGTDVVKALRELRDYTKIPIANLRIRNRIRRFSGQFNNSFGRGYLNSRGSDHLCKGNNSIYLIPNGFQNRRFKVQDFTLYLASFKTF